MSELATRINETLSRSICQGWDRSFLQSILGQLEDKAPLTTRQKETVHQVLQRNTAVEEERHQEWAPVFRNKYQETAMVIASIWQRKNNQSSGLGLRVTVEASKGK